MPAALPVPPAPLSWSTFRDALAEVPLPAAVVDLDALDHNIDLIRSTLDAGTCTLRPATKSVRCPDLLRHILGRGGDRFAGLMCFTALEAVALAADGFDDLLVAYPSVRPAPLRRVARAVSRGATIRLVVDCPTHVEACAEAARAEGTELGVLLELDLSYRSLGGHLHLGARRSPVRSVADARALAAGIRTTQGVRLDGLMGYEAHVASTREADPSAPAQGPVLRSLKRHVLVPSLQRLRQQVVAALRSDGHHLAVVNGGGTGSLRTTPTEAACTEVTAGSGFLCSHLFSGFDDLALQPALFFALEVVRRPDPRIATCLGGGIVASGAAGPDRLPVPWRPLGLHLLGMEGAGEVQTPVRLPPGLPLQPGDPVVFRPAKAGEPAERFDRYLLLRGGRPAGWAATYRGLGHTFL